MARCLRLQLLSFLTTSCELTVARSFTHQLPFFFCESYPPPPRPVYDVVRPLTLLARWRGPAGTPVWRTASPPLTHVHSPVPVVSLSQCMYTPPLLALYWPKAK
ncbi:hypothetical protein RHS04_07740 [Rhizoctonia solani]|uniref:Secreted protein n=1 Tax=Rhizoctonia solani TaxID=456999 RepID=A0A8H7H1Q8_9AGAM|nr:hypothetical protein RHS04_07740 [Rhizoctonia solani]